MTGCVLALAAAIGGVGLAAPPGPERRYEPGLALRGSAVMAIGQAPGRGQPRPFGPRGDSFVPGLTSRAETATRVRSTFQPGPATSVPDRFDVVFYAKARPVRLRIHVATDGRSLAERWNAHLTKLFTAFDRDRSGFLNKYELEHIFPASGIHGMFRGSYYTRANGPPPELAEIDRDGDSRVSPAEFAEYYREVLPELVKPRAIRGPTGDQDATTRELFARLDSNGDGKLSRDELQAAERILLALDADEDECVSTAELLSNLRERTAFAKPVPPRADPRSTGSTEPAPGPVDILVFQSGISETVVKQILKRYGKTDRPGLTRDEIGFDPKTFEHLDRDSNGQLSEEELQAWRTRDPDGVIALTFADSPANCQAVARPASGATWPADLVIRQTEPARLVLRIGSQTLEFHASSPPPGARRNQFQMMFGNVFSSDRKFVEDRDLTGPENQFLRVVFEAADFNADGRLTREEFQRYFELQQSTTDLGMALVFVTRTPNFFQMLDDNVDGKLGVRELRTAWDRLIVLEPSGAEAITKGILQPSVAFRLTPAAFATYDPAALGAPRGPGVVHGPLWFRKMDRNGDGDVSRAEFLGGLAEFALLDINGDGLIALEEAEAYEKLVRPPKKAGPKSAKGKKAWPWFEP